MPTLLICVALAKRVAWACGWGEKTHGHASVAMAPRIRRTRRDRSTAALIGQYSQSRFRNWQSAIGNGQLNYAYSSHSCRASSDHWS
jgi:hypothetical protein